MKCPGVVPIGIILRGQNMVVKQPKIFHIALKKRQPFSCPFLFYNFFSLSGKLSFSSPAETGMHK